MTDNQVLKMRTYPSRAKRHCVHIATGILCAALLAFAPGAIAADRLVICEEFTEAGCLGCGFAGPALSDLIDVYEDSLVFIQFHVDILDPNDPNPDPLIVYAHERMEEFYGSHETPTAVFDGMSIVKGAIYDSDLQYAEYRESYFLPERATPTDVTLDLDITYLGGQDFHVAVTAGVEPDGLARSLRIYVMQALDHWPDYHDYYRNGLKQFAPTEDLHLSPGQSQLVERDMTIDDESWTRQQDIKIIVWAQAISDHGPATIFQAVQRGWPLDPPPNDDDGDGVLDDEDNCPHKYNPLQEDDDLDGVGNVCDNCDGTYNPDQSNIDEDLVGDACDNCPDYHSLLLGDADGDGVGDSCDWCPETVLPGLAVDEFGRVVGTIDIDCDVDADDFALFAACMPGPDITVPPGGCDPTHFGNSDLDNDGDADLADFAIMNRQFTGSLPSPAMYVGVDSCVECHGEKHSVWALTKHANAFQTLVNSGDQENALCLSCHTVGFRKRSGYVDEIITPHLKDVQCENCHGPGSNHVADPANEPMAKDYSSELCGRCHQSCHGLCGDDHHPELEDWRNSLHSQTKYTVPYGSPVECYRCHSTDAYFGMSDPNDPWWFPEYSLNCVVCHTPHDNLIHRAQLRQPTNELCAQCHTMLDAAPGASDPNNPQAEMLHSQGGYKLNGTPMAGPYSSHWLENPDECVKCHWAYLRFDDPNSLLPIIDSGHSSRHNLRACEPCHDYESAKSLVADMHFEMEIRLDAIAPYFTPNNPLYINPAGLTPQQRERYDNAHFNYLMVKRDRSYGSHNPAYARAMLDQTEDYLGLPPWRLLLQFRQKASSAVGHSSNLMKNIPAEIRP